ncbi:MAG: glycosyltransferase family 39 protein [Deltaproteobacteria bacterium]|nr:glycosyltransferase family 39 protein [Deltaproteobacteria bacterium]
MNLFWLILTIVVTRIPSLLIPFWTKDEGYWWILGDSVARGGVLYQSAVDNKPAIFIFFYALAIKCFGSFAMLALHAWVMLGQVLMVSLIYLMVKKALSEKAALVSAACFVALQAGFIAQETLAANSENLMMPWVMLALFVFSRSQSTLSFLIVGLCCGIAFHVRQTAGILLPMFLVLMLLEDFTHLGRSLGRFVLLCFGFLAVSAAVGLYFMKLGAFPEFWFWNVTINQSYIAEPLRFSVIVWEGFWKTATAFLMGFYPWILMCVGLWQWKRGIKRAPLFYAFFGAMLALVFVGFRFSHHYYVQLFPAIALLAGFSVFRLEDNFSHQKWLQPRRLALCLLFPVFVFQMEAWYRVIQEKNGGQRPAIREVAQWLKKSALPGDSLFLWGYYPEIYSFAGLPNASRHVETHYLTGQIRDSIEDRGFVSVKEKLWQDLWQDFEAHPPTWIVDTSFQPVSGRSLHPLTKYPDMLAYVHRYYTPVATVQGSHVYRRIQP